MIRLNEIFCKGCNLCIEFCPRKVLAPSHQPNRKGVKVPIAVEPDKCTNCRYCEVVCPDSAIFIDTEDNSQNEYRG